MLLTGTLYSRVSKIASCVAIIGAIAVGGSAFAQKPEQILGRAPVQPDVDVDYPAAGEEEKCVIKQYKEQGYTGVALYAPDGTTILRVWAASTPKPGQKAQVDQIRFFKHGVEVYRDVLGKESRWLNNGGMRRGILGEDKKTIASWSVISPQETAQEVVSALKTNDFARYQRVALSAQDLTTLGVGQGPVAKELQNQVKSVTENAFAQLAQTLAIPEDAKWGALNAGLPAAIPAGENFSKDLEAYYNVAIIVMDGADASKSQELYVGDMIKVGDAWKVVGLPAGEPFGQATGSVAANSILLPTEGSAAASAVSGDVGEMGAVLTEAYNKLESASPAEYPALCDSTVDLLLQLAASTPQESDNLLSQAVDVIFSGVQSGLYPDGAAKLDALGEKLADAGDEVKARLRQRQITAAFYAVAQSNPQPKPSELAKAQEKYTEDLAAFVEEYPTTAAAAEAAMSLALDQEYLLENDGAMKYYQQAAQNASGTLVGRKAAGALARLKSEGGAFNMPKLQYSDGTPCEFKPGDKPTVVFFWGSWDSEGVAGLKALASQVNVIGVNVDTTPDPANADAYFAQITKGLPWKNVCDPAGLDGEAAVAFGVQTAPWIILVDKDGKVVRSNIANVEELADVLKGMK